MSSNALHEVDAINSDITWIVLVKIHIFGSHLFDVNTLFIAQRQFQEEVSVTIYKTMFTSMGVFQPMMTMTTTGMFVTGSPRLAGVLVGVSPETLDPGTGCRTGLAQLGVGSGLRGPPTAAAVPPRGPTGRRSKWSRG